MHNTTYLTAITVPTARGGRLRCLIMALLLSVVGAVNAAPGEIHFTKSGPVPQLLELFTSQGCSSCPSADAFVNRLLDDEGLWNEIVPVVFHVDYWDYLGWQDLYSDSRYSSRQRNYRSLGRVNSVYTPGFLLDAREWLGYFRNPSLPKSSNRYGGTLNIDSIEGARTRLRISYQTASASPEQHYVHLALLGFGLRTNIQSGENRGKQLPYEFTVLSFQTEPLSSKDAVTWMSDVNWIRTNHDAKRYGLAAWVTTSHEQTPAQVLGGWLNNNQAP